jgi:hypothetical protein
MPQKAFGAARVAGVEDLAIKGFETSRWYRCRVRHEPQ